MDTMWQAISIAIASLAVVAAVWVTRPVNHEVEFLEACGRQCLMTGGSLMTVRVEDSRARECTCRPSTPNQPVAK